MSRPSLPAGKKRCGWVLGVWVFGYNFHLPHEPPFINRCPKEGRRCGSDDPLETSFSMPTSSCVPEAASLSGGLAARRQPSAELLFSNFKVNSSSSLLSESSGSSRSLLLAIAIVLGVISPKAIPVRRARGGVLDDSITPVALT